MKFNIGIFLYSHPKPAILILTVSATKLLIFILFIFTLFLITSSPGYAVSEEDVVWSADFETGDISQWSPGGGFIKQGSSGKVDIITSPVHSGKYAAALSINTSEPSSTGNQAAYLFRWQDLPGKEYYYSAWYYIPSNINPGSWWNIFQWKSMHSSGNDPMIVLDAINYSSGQTGLVMYWRADNETLRKRWTQENLKPIPRDTWFQIEGYYKQSTLQDGHVTVWQDGVKIFDVKNLQTALSEDTVHWSINNYTSNITPPNTTIYVDDAVISKTKVGTGNGSTPNPTPTTPPTISPTPPPTPTASPTIPGDANGDGKVDGLDYTLWIDHYGTTNASGPSEGDFNGDHNVDGLDYVIWVDNYGT